MHRYVLRELLMKPYRRIGLILLGLLSLGDLLTLLLTEGEAPPYPVAAAVSALGLLSLGLVVRAWRDPERSTWLLIGLRALSALAALPALFITDVPGPAKAAALAAVVLNAVGILLLRSARKPVTA